MRLWDMTDVEDALLLIGKLDLSGTDMIKDST